VTKLILERREQRNATDVIPVPYAVGEIFMSPVVEEEYWSYRVRLSATQAVVGFPKYSGIGIGFAVEEDYNVNLPYSTHESDIFWHIIRNKGDDSIPDDDVRAAISMIRSAVIADRAGPEQDERLARMAAQPLLYPNGRHDIEDADE
jgi:hypothetical protein